MTHVPYHPHAHKPCDHVLDTVRVPVGEQAGTAFDDSEALALDNFHFITTVEVFYDDSRVYGFNATHKDLAGTVTTSSHSSRTDVSKAVLSLGNDEFIVQISGLQQGGIARLRLQTNRGHYVDVGGKEGAAFSIPFPLAFGVKGLTGRLGDNLQAIGAVLRPIFMRQSVEAQFPPRKTQENRLDFADNFPRNPENAGVRRVGMTFSDQGFLSLEVQYWPEDLKKTVTFPNVGGENVIGDVFDLSLGESLIRVHGTISDGIVTSLGLETTKGRKRSWGKAKGEVFSDEVRPGHRAAGLTPYGDASGLKGVKLDVCYPLPNTIAWTRK